MYTIPLTLVLTKSTTGYDLAKDLKEQYPVTAHAPNFDFGQDVPKSKDGRRVREL